MRIITFTKKEKDRFDNLIKEKYGFSLPPCQIIKQTNDKLRIFTGNLSEHELNILTGAVRVETVGLYLATRDNKDSEEKNESIRFSFDASFLGKQAKKNVLEINDQQIVEWFSGNDLVIDLNESLETNDKSAPLNSHAKLSDQEFILLKYKDEIVGCGKLTSDKDKIINFVPKERRIKN